MKRKSLLLMMLLALFSAGAWAQEQESIYSNFTATAGTGGTGNEGYAKLVDSDTDTKWCQLQQETPYSTTNAYCTFRSADLITPVGYVLTTGNDTGSHSGRNPKSWRIEASTDNSNWVILEDITCTESNKLPASNTADKSYHFQNSNTTAYRYFKFTVTDIWATSYDSWKWWVFQLAEFKFITVPNSGGDSGDSGDSDCTEIGTVNTSNSNYTYGPVNDFYNYSYYQIIYPKAEVPTGSITSIGFNYAYTTAMSKKTNVTIYMGTTSSNTLSDWMNVGTMTKVYTGNLNCTQGWNDFTLTTPYSYSGSQNLVVVIMDQSGQYDNSNCKFYYATSSDNVNKYAYTDNNYITFPTNDTGTPTVSSSASSGNVKYYPVTRFCTAPSIPYEISTVEDWNAFCAAVNSGHSYSGETVTLMNDITTAVTTMAGTIDGDNVGNAFKGTFDGQGHTLTLNISGGTTEENWYFTAPFRCIDGATIENLKTAGTVTQTGGKGAAGLVGCSTGTCAITNCDVNVTIDSRTNGDGTHGGFLSFIKSGSSVTFNGCAFTGSITGETTRYCGGFVGYTHGSVTLNNCVFYPTEISFDADHSGDNSSNFVRPSESGTYNNCYYKQTCGSVVKGKLMHSITGASGITVANAGTPTSYTPETSTIVGYGTGIKFNNILYAGSGENVSLTLTGASEYEADYGTLTGSGSSYALTMAASNTIISGISCAVPTNLQCTYYTPTSATLSWTAGGDETQWHVQYGPQGSPNPQILSTMENPYVLPLTEGNTYEIKVRAVCDDNNNVWSDWSNTITVTPQALTYEFTNNGGTGDHQWNTPDNWQYYVGSELYTATTTTMPTINDNVQINAACTIPSGCLAQANEITFLNNESTGIDYGSITIEDGGQLQHNNADGVVTVKRYIAPYGSNHAYTNLGYKIISFPVVNGINPRSEFIEGLLTPNNPYDFYTFNYNNQEQNVYLEWMHVNVSNDDLLYPNMGFLYASQNGTTISVTGDVAPSVNQEYHLDYEAGVAPFNGWKLVGNPFVCNAYLTANGGNLDFYEIEDHTQSRYAEFSLNDNTVAIPPMGGVMVRVKANDDLVYSRTAPSKGPGILNMNVNKLIATKDGASTETIDRARLRFGQGRNLEKLQLNPRHTKLYIPEDGNDYAVYYAEGAGTIPVNFKAQDNGSYTLSFSTEDVSFNYLHLIDNMNGNDVDLLQTPYYTFDAKSTDFASRFTLVFATGNDNDDTFAFFNNGVWIINNPSTGSGAEATLQVIDVLGHILSSETISGSCSKAINVAPGVYMLRLVNGNDVKVQKIVVR